MKTTFKMLSLLVLLSVGTLSMPERVSAYTSVTFQLFYDQLSPYGYWMSNPQYGYVWVPNVAAGFSPYYTGGHWTYTQFGWMWVSDYAWGWAAFHYGNWYYDPFYGWMWIPGTMWAPAWVVWSTSPGYYGWAPLGPGVNINLVFSGAYRIPPERWVFVPSRYLNDPHIDHYYGPRSNNTVIIQKSTIINNTYVDNSTHVTYVKGPDRNEVQRATGKNVEESTVKNMQTPGEKVSRGEVSIYRPMVEKTSGNAHPAPVKVVTQDEMKKKQMEKSAVKEHQAAPAKTLPSQEHNQPRTPPSQQEAAPVKPHEQPAKDNNPKSMAASHAKAYDYAWNGAASADSPRKTDASMNEKNGNVRSQQSVKQASTNTARVVDRGNATTYDRTSVSASIAGKNTGVSKKKSADEVEKVKAKR